MYNMVYLGRFNLNNLLPELSGQISLTQLQQEMISLSVFLGYAAGSLLNGYLADRYGGKRFVILGAAASVACNVGIGAVGDWRALLLVWIVNGFFQSMIWIGGMVMLVHWWPARERGKGVGIANFFSGLSHVTAYLLPALLLSLWPGLGLGAYISVPMSILTLFLVLFAALAVEAPEKKGLPPYIEEEAKLAAKEAPLRELAEKNKLPYACLLTRKRFLWWCLIALLSSTCRYGLLTWIPYYYREESGQLISETFSNITLPLGMAFGTLLVTWVAGTRMFQNKGLVIVVAAALCGTLTVIFPRISEPQIVLTGIFFTGFFLYGINGVLWLYAMDEAGRIFPGTGVGILNCCAYLGAFLEAFIFPWVIRGAGSSIWIFVAMGAFCIGMVVCGMAVCRKNTVIEPETRE